MNIFRINNKYVAVAIFLMFAVTLQAQDYGALQYMLQKLLLQMKSSRAINSMNISFLCRNRPYSLLTSGDSQDGMGMTAHLFMGKWITPVHGLRMGVNLGYLPSGIYDSKIKMGAGSLDYCWICPPWHTDTMQIVVWVSRDCGYRSRLFWVGDNTIVPKRYPDLSWRQLLLWCSSRFGNVRLSSTLDLFVEPRSDGIMTVLRIRKIGETIKWLVQVLQVWTYMPGDGELRYISMISIKFLPESYVYLFIRWYQYTESSGNQEYD